MIARRGSWPPLVLAVVVFGLCFALVRSRSRFLAIEADAATARTLAAAHGVPIADVFALRDGCDAADAAVFARVVADYAAARARCGDPLAAMLALGCPAAPIERELVAAGGQPAAAWQAFAPSAAALPGLRFLELRRRFAERRAAQN